MHKSTYNGSLVAVGTIAFLLITIAAAPMEPEEEASDNDLMLHDDVEYSAPAPWDAVNAAALRKFLMQLDDERLSPRVGRSWPPEPRGWLRRPDGRVARQWRADKRQVRFRQCYFNPISCFRK